MRSKSYCVEGAPISWQRARLKGQRFFDGQMQEKMLFGLHIQKQHGSEPLFSSPIAMTVTFFMSQPYAKRNNYYHSGFPDLDNLCKFLLDAMKDVVLTDDKIICSLIAKKIYDKHPRTEFIITEMGVDEQKKGKNPPK